MDTKDLLYIVGDAARENRLAFTVFITLVVGFLSWFGIPHIPPKPTEASTPPATTTVTKQQAGDDAQCANMSASGNGTVSCSASQDDDKEHAPKKPTAH